MGKFLESKHESFVKCKSCHAKNAPAGSRDFEKYCYNCGVELDTEAPVDVGDRMEIFVNDMNREGDGVGRTEEGFVIFVEGVVPEEVVEVEVNSINDSSASADLISRDTDKKVEDFRDEKNEEDKNEKSTKRRDFWGE